MKRLIITLSIIVTATLTVLFAVGLKLEADQSKTTQIQPVQQIQTIQLNADTIFNLVNAERAKNGLKPLIRDARLDQSAQQKADDMVANNYFAHINPNTQVNGYTLIPNGICSYKSENIGFSHDIGDNNQKQINWWMNSKPHHDAILDEQYDTTGVAVNSDKVVQHFCNLK